MKRRKHVYMQCLRLLLLETEVVHNGWNYTCGLHVSFCAAVQLVCYLLCEKKDRICEKLVANQAALMILYKDKDYISIGCSSEVNKLSLQRWELKYGKSIGME